MVTLMEYAKLADKVYTQSTEADPSILGWRSSNEYFVDDASVFAGGSFWSSGLQMRLFTKEGSPEAVIAYKGTKLSMVSDLRSDLAIGAQALPVQAVEALKHTKEWKVRLGGVRVTLVGHSLGGAIAQVAGSVTDSKFVTFNAPGMWTNAVGVCALRKLLNTTGLGVNYIKWGDVVGNFGKHIGRTERVRSMGHSIVGFIDYLNGRSIAGQDPLA